MTEAEIIAAMAEATPGYSTFSDSDKALRKNLISLALSGLRAHGLEVVSVEPTEAMIEAWHRYRLSGEPFTVERAYRAMISSATPTAGK